MTSLTQPTKMISKNLLILLACAIALTGCHKKSNTVDPSTLGPSADSTAANTTPAPTASITADPVAIDLGGTVVLNWRTTNATTVTIDGIGQVNVNGTQTVSPSNSTNFHLTAKGDGGTTEANVRVTVRVTTIPSGGSTTQMEGGRDGNGLNGANGQGGPVTAASFAAAVQDMFFDYDSFDVRPDAQTSAAQAASFLVQHPGLRILVTGYADERGSAEYNLALGENRANAAKAALVSAGVAGARIRAFSVGKEKQFCTEANETCWQENRRAQFTIDQ